MFVQTGRSLAEFELQRLGQLSVAVHSDVLPIDLSEIRRAPHLFTKLTHA